MTEPTDNAEIENLRLLVWDTHLSVRVEEFSKIIEDDEIFNKYFGADYIGKITSKSKQVFNLELKLSIAYLALMVVLFYFHTLGVNEFEFAGYGFKNVGAFKEVLLLIAVTLLPIVAIQGAYRTYLTAIAKECIKKLHSREDSREFYSLIFIDEYLGWIEHFKYNSKKSWHVFPMILMLVLWGFIVSLALIIFAGSFFVQVSVVYDVVTKPVSSKYINYFVVTYTSLAIFLSWIVHAHKFPLPLKDLTYYSKLDELQENNPSKYQEWLHKEAEKMNKREGYFEFFWTTSIYALLFTGVTVYFFPEKFEVLALFIFEGVAGVFIVLIISNIALTIIKVVINEKWKKERTLVPSNDLEPFRRYRKRLKLTYVFVPTLIAFIYIIREYDVVDLLVKTLD